ncbi:glycosyltransferase family 2 protein [Oscillatoria sp. CS-180]|uniref:glycosyltransferase family 2 protein n=1 Tax=Oscillatoria sp. CS-180 TaxID=3021720 RepID=UPI00232B6AA4|nr:glycosyltransferase family 2 protein [Oscillatoria sp. CS-180]MDB9525340.1 glycosyltransferase family 2 protein [Oscillatoria sp. CS-180]
MVKVSVCIPTYNRSHLLTCAIASVLEQDYHDFEIIVCDDGSKDDTPERMAEWSDARIRYIRHEQNIGKSNNMISGYKAAQGEYFIKFDDDDRLTPQFLSQTVAILDQHSDIDFVGTDHWVINSENQREVTLSDANSERWGRTTLPAGPIQDLLTRVFVQQSLQIGATLFRKSVLDEISYMRPNLQNCEDNDLLVRLALAGKQAYYLPDRLMEYRFHDEQQGIGRAIPYLKDKIQYLNLYKFSEPALETIRCDRLRETQLLLGLRLVEIGETQQGKDLLRQGEAHSKLKARAGQFIALFPRSLRPSLFGLLRRMKN